MTPRKLGLRGPRVALLRRRMVGSRWRACPWLAAWVSLAACSSGAPQYPEPRTFEATLSNPYAIELSHPLRYTVVWTAGDASLPQYTMLGGGPVDAEASSFPVELRMPSPELLARLTPKVDLLLSLPSSEVTLFRVTETHRPRVVVYEDTNENEHLDLKKDGTTGEDQVLAIDDDYYTIAAILDLETLLRSLPSPLVDLYYQATDGRFTPFVPTSGTSGYLYLGDEKYAASYSLDDSGSPLASLRCLRSVFDTRSTSSSIVVLDKAVDPAVCGLDHANCRSVKLESMPAPAVTRVSSSRHHRAAACRRRGALEALALSEALTQCEGCACETDQKTSVFITTKEALPSWWPCGDEVHYCKSEVSLAAFPSDCIEKAGSTEEED